VSVEDEAGGLLIVLPLAFNLCFFLLARSFDYPDILRRPGSAAQYRAEPARRPLQGGPRPLPGSGPGDLQDLQGPSYVYAILTDPRVRTSHVM
jgi:hypothetical protein